MRPNEEEVTFVDINSTFTKRNNIINLSLCTGIVVKDHLLGHLPETHAYIIKFNGIKEVWYFTTKEDRDQCVRDIWNLLKNLYTTIEG